MSRNPNRGRVYRRCGCRDATGRQLGARCPALADAATAAGPSPSTCPASTGDARPCAAAASPPANRRPTALPRSWTASAPGSGRRPPDRRRYLATWLGTSPNAQADHRGPLPRLHHKDLSRPRRRPAGEAHPPARRPLRRRATRRQAADPPPSAAASRPCPARSATPSANAACMHNPARYAHPTAPDAGRAPAGHPPSRHVPAPLRIVDDPLTDLFELLICTGMRKGEALALHWADVDLDARCCSSARPCPTSTTARRSSPLRRPAAATPGLACPPGPWQRCAVRPTGNSGSSSPPAPGITTRISYSRGRHGQPLRPEYVLRPPAHPHR